MQLLQPQSKMTMIAFWNRKSVYVGSDLQQFNRVRDYLDESRIQYRYRVKELGSRPSGLGRGSVGVSGADFRRAVIYEIWVHKKDGDRIQP